MSEITVPDQEGLSLDEYSLSVPAQRNRSGWTGKGKVIGLPGIEYWIGKVTVRALSTESEEQPWRAFLFGLRGPVNWFRLSLPCASHAGSKPVVGSAPGNGYTLPLSGMATSQTILLAGQFMTVPLPSGRYRTVCLTANLVSNGSGTGTATFEPALGETPTVGVTVETKAAFLPLSLVGSAPGFVQSDGVSSATFDVEEAR